MVRLLCLFFLLASSGCAICIQRTAVETGEGNQRTAVADADVALQGGEVSGDEDQ